MIPTAPDNELVTDFAKNGSEGAFQSLVNRHVGLVYATALRQVGDPGVAEEITQNVFVALARKAPGLRGMHTIAGWLHRSAILESKARIRSELRRARREEIAAEVASIEHQGSSIVDTIMPLLDEALLTLRETDRLALMLRFWEDRSLRDVGAALGVDEDAARKRVARALDRLGEVFRERGLQLGGGASCVTLLCSAANATVPAGVAASAAGAGLGAPAAAGLNLFLLNLMGLTKTQTAAICLAVVAVPLGVQWQANARLNDEQRQLGAQLAAASQRAVDAEADLARSRAGLSDAHRDTATAEARLAAVPPPATQPQKAVYRWDDNAQLIRVPKSMLKSLQISAVTNRSGGLSKEIKEVLSMTAAEEQATQTAMQRFISSYNAARLQTLRTISGDPKEIEGRSPEEARSFDAGPIPYAELRDTLFADLEGALGPERSALFNHALQLWMPTENVSGLNTGWAVLDADHRMHFLKPQPGDRSIRFKVYLNNENRGSMAAAYNVQDIPDLYRPYLQDWIAIAESPKQSRKQ